MVAIERKIGKKLTKAQEFYKQQDELREKMKKVILFPGGLDEYVQKNGGKYEFIELHGSKQFLEGEIGGWEDINRFTSARLSILNPINFFKILNSPRNDYSQIIAEAVSLGADALIHYTQSTEVEGGLRVRETGVPIRKIGGFVWK